MTALRSMSFPHWVAIKERAGFVWAPGAGFKVGVDLLVENYNKKRKSAIR